MAFVYRERHFIYTHIPETKIQDQIQHSLRSFKPHHMYTHMIWCETNNKKELGDTTKQTTSWNLSYDHYYILSCIFIYLDL